ncbi:MAG: hypothetical protein AB7J32_23670 [Pseudonocardia sp.]
MERDVGRDRPGPGQVPPGGPVPRSAPTTFHPTAAARAYGRADPTSVVPLPGAPPPAQGLSGAPATAPHRRTWLWALIAGLVVVALLGVGGVVVLTRGESAPVAGGPAVAPPPGQPSVPAAPPANPAPPVDPTSAQGRLDAQVRTDAAAVAALADRWVPQLYAERSGAVRGSATMDATSILRDYTAVKAQYPNALLLASGDFTSFAMPGYYVVVEPRPFATAQEAVTWCTAEGRSAEFCYAKLLSHTAGPDGSTVYRN